MTLGDVRVEVQASTLVARLAGEVDQSNARGIEEAIALATPNHASLVVLDLSELHYLDSAGIQLIYQLREKLQVRSQELRLVLPVDSPAADALRLAGVLGHLDVSETVGDALEESLPESPTGVPAPKSG